jgi:Protein of unknown function (DUF4038)
MNTDIAVLPAWCRTYIEALPGDKEKDRDLSNKIMETDTVGTCTYGKFVGNRYKKHPNIHDYKNGEFNAWHLRQRAYWSALAGATGFTYGATGIYDMVKPGREGKPSHFKNYWYNAMDYEGANDMIHLRHLFEKMKFQTPALVPNQSLLLTKMDTVDAHVLIAHSKRQQLFDSRFHQWHKSKSGYFKIGKWRRAVSVEQKHLNEKQEIRGYFYKSV